MSVLLPGNAQTYSKDPARFPMIADDAVADFVDGADVCIDGTRWIDLVSGMGAVILGHGRTSPVRKAATQLEHFGVSFPIPTRLDTQVAEQLISMLTWQGAESVRFGKNGADVVTSAVRLARAVTGRWDVAYFDYAGHHDWCMTEPPKNGGVPPQIFSSRSKRSHISDLIFMMETTDGYAAVVMEAVPSNHPETPSPEFFEKVRKACDETGTLLIIDEMVTGFRMAPGGACEALGIQPDIAVYGKAMANGFPLSAIVGPYNYLKRYEEDVFFSLTHGGEAVSLAAGLATMKVVQERNVPELLRPLGERILKAAGPYGKGYPQRPVFSFSREALRTMGDGNVLCGGYANLTLAHVETPGVADTIVGAVEAARHDQEAMDRG